MIQPCVIRIGVQRVILILMSATHGMRVAPLVTRNRVVKSAANLVKPRPYLQHRGSTTGDDGVLASWLTVPCFSLLSHIIVLRYVKSCTYLLKKKKNEKERKKEKRSFSFTCMHASSFKFASWRISISQYREWKIVKSIVQDGWVWRVGTRVDLERVSFPFQWKKSREAACILSKYIQWKNHLVKLDNRSIRYNDNNRSDNNNNRRHHYYLA